MDGSFTYSWICNVNIDPFRIIDDLPISYSLTIEAEFINVD